MNDDCLYIITEFCGGGDLEDYLEIILKAGLTVPEPLVSEWVLQIGGALKVSMIWIHNWIGIINNILNSNAFLISWSVLFSQWKGVCPGSSVGSDANCQPRGCELKSQPCQYSVWRLTKVNAQISFSFLHWANRLWMKASSCLVWESQEHIQRRELAVMIKLKNLLFEMVALNHNQPRLIL